MLESKNRVLEARLGAILHQKIRARREDKHNEAPEGSGRLWKSIENVSKGPGTRLPPSYSVVFSRRVPRVGNLPSEGKKVVYPPVVLRFFQQKSNLVLDTHHAGRMKKGVATV